jgi:hypothetical protein
VDQEEWPCIKKWMCWFFYYIPKNNNVGKINFITCLCHGSLPFSNRAPLVASPTAKLVGPCQWIIYSLKYVLWGPRTSWSLWQFFLGVNQSGCRTSSTTNHRFYRALRQLHGPWCKPPLSKATPNCYIKVSYPTFKWGRCTLDCNFYLCTHFLESIRMAISAKWLANPICFPWSFAS